MPSYGEFLRPLNQMGMRPNFDTEGIAETQAQNIYSYQNSFYRNAMQPIMYADDYSLLVTNQRAREQYLMPWNSASQLNNTSDMTIPEEARSFDPRAGMHVSRGYFDASGPLHHEPRMQSLERNVTVFHETVPHPMVSYSSTRPAGSPVTQISGNAHNSAVTPALTVARALEPEAPGTQSGPLYEAVEGGYRCITCDKVIKREHDMHRHLKTTVRHGGKRLECSACGEFYTRPSTLRDHVCVELEVKS